MKPARNWMRFTLVEAEAPGNRFDAIPLRIEHAPLLARLMDVAYTDTIDHEGETPEQCLAEIRGTIEGKYGPVIGEASFIFMVGESASIC